jgi:hypothetical protein
MGQMFFTTLKDGFCNKDGPCTILAGKVGVQYADGTEANPGNGLYIHHILTAATTKHQSPWISTCEAPTKPGFSITSFGGTGFLGNYSYLA